jgi:hypothetical protein
MTGGFNYSDLMIPFGRRADGIMVGAADPGLPNGLACNCFCPQCKGRLVAKNRGEEKRPHFSHEPTEATAMACVNAGESSVHLMAKQVIANSVAIILPKAHGQRTEDLVHKLSRVRLEVWCDDHRPDIIATYDGQLASGESRPLAKKGDDVVIEIAVTHPCDRDKISKLRARGVPAFEIDLSAMSCDATEASIRRSIDIAPREWLFHPLVDAAKAALNSALAQESIDRQRRDAAKKTETRKLAITDTRKKAAAAAVTEVPRTAAEHGISMAGTYPCHAEGRWPSSWWDARWQPKPGDQCHVCGGAKWSPSVSGGGMVCDGCHPPAGAR